MRPLFLTILSMFLLSVTYSQTIKSDRTFVNNFYDAEAYMYEGNYEAATELWLKLEQKDPENPNIWYKLGTCYVNTSKDKQIAVNYLEKAAEHVNPNYKENNHKERSTPIDTYFQLGTALRKIGEYDKSINSFDEAKNFIISNEIQGYEDYIDLIDENINISKNAKKITTEKPNRKIKITNLGNTVNSSYSDHSPIISCDGNKLYFTSKRPNEISTGEYEKIYVTNKIDGQWSSPEILPSPINTRNQNESVVSISSDGNTMYFFRSGTGLQGNLYVTKLNDNGEWETPQLLHDEINTKYRETHISISPDGNTMYFTSDRPEGFGGLDIYSIRKLPNGEWTHPQLLSDSINTVYDEECPLVHPNGKILFFNSKGHENIGGYDVFSSDINEDGTFDKAESLGFPINTSDNDVSYSLSCDGITGYIASIREDSYGEYDIYEIIRYEQYENNAIVYSGSIEYADSTIPQNVLVSIKNTASGKIEGTYPVDNQSGKYLCSMDTNNEYELLYSKNGLEISKLTKTTSIEDKKYYESKFEPVELDKITINFYTDIAYINLIEGEQQLNNEVFSTLSKIVKKKKEVDNEIHNLTINLIYNSTIDTAQSAEYKMIINYFTNNEVKISDISHNAKQENTDVYNVNISINQAPVIAEKNDDNNSNNETKTTEQPTIGTQITQPEKVGDQLPQSVIEVENIFFDFDKSDIRSEYYANLDKIAEYMVNNPGAKIEIGGHTDDLGTNEYNYLLSYHRAKSVKDYLVSKGASQENIITQKYGKTQPMTENTATARKYNRRAEFKVLVQGTENQLVILPFEINDNGYTGIGNASASNGNKVARKYTVQLYALRKIKPVEDFDDLVGVKLKSSSDGWNRYYIGEFSSYKDAKNLLDSLNKTHPDAFIRPLDFFEK